VNGWLPGFLIGLAPLVLLVATLLAGRYPGEKAIERCRQAITTLLSRARGRSAPVRFPAFFASPVRGGRLMANSLAGRGPPETIRI